MSAAEYNGQEPRRTIPRIRGSRENERERNEDESIAGNGQPEQPEQANEDSIRDARIDHPLVMPGGGIRNYIPEGVIDYMRLNNPESAISKRKEWQLGEVLDFGKHKGETIQEVIFKDIGWITWAVENIKDFILASSTKQHYNEMLRKKGRKPSKTNGT